MPDVAAALSYRAAPRVRLDPRTSLLALLIVNVVCLSAGFTGLALWGRAIVCLIPLALLAGQGRWLAAIVCVGATGLALATESFGLAALGQLNPTSTLSWVASLALLVAGAVANLAARFVPVVLMAWYVITTVRAGQLMGALGRLHLPRAIVIPLAVVLRMVPVLPAESTAIGQAARTRGLRGLARPTVLISYRVVPLTMRTIDIGDELTRAGLTRGLQASGARSCYGRIGFGWADGLILLLAGVAVALFALGV